MQVNITNNTYGRLTAIKSAGKQGKEYKWLFRCDCGNEVLSFKGNVTSGKTTSCGCYHKERTSQARFKHGGIKLPEYRVWDGIIQRTSNPLSNAYGDYGGRGITVCDRWRDFTNFYADMGERPSTEYSIDRKNNNGNYEPSNCRWATRKEQANNRRNNHTLTYNGRTQTIAEWADEIDVTYFALYLRIYKGKTIERALTMRTGR